MYGEYQMVNPHQQFQYQNNYVVLGGHLYKGNATDGFYTLFFFYKNNFIGTKALVLAK